MEVVNRALNGVKVIDIGNDDHIPGVGDKPLRDVLGEGDISVALDRDAVRVVDPTEVAQLEVPGE